MEWDVTVVLNTSRPLKVHFPSGVALEIAHRWVEGNLRLLYGEPMPMGKVSLMVRVVWDKCLNPFYSFLLFVLNCT